MSNNKSDNYKVSAHKNTLKDWNFELKNLWVEAGHEIDLKESTVSEKEVR